MIQKILLAIDGSHCSEQALYFAASLARSYHASIVLVHAFIPPPHPGSDGPTPESIYETREQAESLAEEAAGRLREMGIEDVESIVVKGPAINVITGTAESYKPDMVIIGARGQSLWPGNQLGSVSMAVTQRVECPVLVVR
ncbi:MAG: universal stress protein [Chloroflexi bacterium]|jgi:nucleotide-binding universal stress UspA family protein|nr:universal stress protein [Chloroflexota bacterium]